MKLKSIVTALVMAGTFGAGAATLDRPGVIIANKSPVLGQITKTTAKKSNKPGVLSKAAQAQFAQNKKNQAEYLKKNFHDGMKKYIVRLVDSAVPSYKGDIEGYEATKEDSFNARSSNSLKYSTYLDTKQNELLQKAASQGISIPMLKSLKFAINGLVTELSYNDAQRLSKMPEVAFVEQSTISYIDTDTGPLQIGAGDVWDGTATGVNLMGEGIIIGVIDTGINTDHSSFAVTGDDGYTVVNPYGAGVFVGDCVADASLCNDKLIGVYSYSAVTDAYADPIFAGDTRPANGEDHNGHGSHTAGTAGGNVLLNVPLIGSDPSSDSSTGDGVPPNGTSFAFDRMSGVAPHANIISYQICAPGNRGDTYSGCFSAAGIGAIDDAISDGVDVLNYSIGGSTNFSPWTSATEIGYLNANAAGIFVATSAGNSGPGPVTTTKASPWYTSVAATNHGRTVAQALELDGSFYSFTASQGPALPSTLTTPIIYAGDVDAANVEGCDPFPAASFTDSIAFISRGACAFADKINNATDAGANFVIVHNNRDGNATLIMGGTSTTTIPSVMVSQNSGASMVASIDATAGLSVTLDATLFAQAFGQPDIMASFSSRGSNPFVDMIVPQIGAPGVNVYAAWSDDQPFMDVTGGAPADYAMISGTSMASPHIAGSAALVMQAHPDWNVDEVRSALMMTATTANTFKEDGVTPTDHFDIGAGRVQVDQAVNAGLVMSEIVFNYEQADPALGGDVKTLNVPSMANFLCERICSWTRTFTAKVSGTYSFSASNPAISTSPGSIEAVAGNDYSVSFVVNAEQVAAGEVFFENVIITSSVADAPVLHLPVYAKITSPSLPDSLDLKVGQNSGSYTIRGLYTTPTDNLTIVLDGMFGAAGEPVETAEEFMVAQDPTPNDPYAQNYDELYIGEEFMVGDGGLLLTVSLGNTTSPDFDLFLEQMNEDGSWSNRGASQTAASDESISINTPAAGTYRAIVQNWQASASGTDTGVINVVASFITDALPVVKIVQPTSTNDGFTPFELELTWGWDLSVGDMFNGNIIVMASGAELGSFPIVLTRVSDDVSVSSTETDVVTRGDIIEYTIDINRNLYSSDLNYTLTVDLASGTSPIEGSFVVEGAEADLTIKDPNAVGFSASEEFAIAEDSDNSSIADLTDGIFVYEFEVPSATLLMEVSIRNSTSGDNDLFIQFDRDGTGNWSTIDAATAATAIADEETSIAAPEAGLYRAIVQNWASGSGLELDTGVLNVDLTPATGDGFIMNLTSNAVEGYSVTSSLLSGSCNSNGWSIFGLPDYIPLANFGVPGLGAVGDTFSFNILEGVEFNHYGESKVAGMTLTDDGFLMFSGDSGSTPWVNQSIPNEAAPNDMLAMLWRDMVVVEEGIRGIRAANFGQGFIAIDFNGLEAFGNSNDQYSFTLWAYTDKSILGRPHDYVVMYGDLAPNFRNSTAGAEDATGLFGIDVSHMIQPNSQLCYTAGEMGSVITVTYQVQTGAETVNTPILLTVESDMNNSAAFTDIARIVTANVAPTANAGGDKTVNRTGLIEIELDGSATADLDADQLVYTWTGPGEIALAGTGTPRAFFRTAGVANGTYTFSLSVTDGEFTSTDEVAITLEGAEGSSGSGSMAFLLMLLGLPLYFRRRNSLKK